MSEFRALDYLRAVRDAADLDKNEKAVLVWLLSYADANGKNCHPAGDTIARVSGMSRATVCRALRTLQARGGWFTWTRKSRTAVNEYELGAKSHGATSQPATSPRATSQPETREVSQCDFPKSQGETRSAHRPAHPPAHGEGELVLAHENPRRATSKGKYTFEEADRAIKLRDHFDARFESVKGCKPMQSNAADNAASYRLVRTYGLDEAMAIVDRAFQDPFVVDKNATLRFVASKADTFRGKSLAATSTGRRERNPVQASAGFAAQLTAATANGVQPLHADEHKRWGRKSIGEGGET